VPGHPPANLPAEERAGRRPAGQASPQAFPRSARLTKPSDFKRVFDQAVASGDAYLRVLARRGSSERSRLGMAVSRQVDRKASGRNRIKRVIRESFRHHFGAEGRYANAEPLDFVVLPRQACATISNAQLFATLEKHWAQVVARSARPSLPRQ
jgi:ribonuclease P protein component